MIFMKDHSGDMRCETVVRSLYESECGPDGEELECQTKTSDNQLWLERAFKILQHSLEETGLCY